MSTTILFSDVHLKVSEAARPRREQFLRFLHYLREEENCKQLICLGDLFDFWFEYEHVCFSGYFEVLRAFADLRDAGVELHLICGNHDFWAGRFLEEHLGMQVHPDTFFVEIAGRRVFLLHGDGINPADRSYRLYKRFARNPLVAGAFRLLHPDWAMRLAQGVSHGSRTLLQVEDPTKGPEAQALRVYAQEFLAAGKADIIACGHAHAPTIESFPTPEGMGLYINTGDWLKHRTYVVEEAGEFRMRRFEPEE